MTTYPKWLYSANGAQVVPDEATHAALGGSWYESPVEVPVAGHDAPVIDRDALIAAAEDKGIKVDKRWSDARLAAEIEKA